MNKYTIIRVMKTISLTAKSMADYISENIDDVDLDKDIKYKCEALFEEFKTLERNLND